MRVKSPFSQSALFGFIVTLLLGSLIGLWGYNVFASRTAPLINPNEYLRRVLIAERFIHHGPKRPHEVALAIHQFAQTNVQSLDTINIPVEGGDLVGQVKELHGELVPLRLILSQSGVGACDDGIGEHFRVSQGIGHSVRRKRVLETGRVSDQRPATSPRLPNESGPSGKRVELAHAFGAGDRIGKFRIRLPERFRKQLVET